MFIWIERIFNVLGESLPGNHNHMYVKCVSHLFQPLLGNGMGLLGSGGHFPMGISGPMVAGGMGDKGIVSDWRNGNDPFSPGYVKSARSVSIMSNS